MIDKLKINLPSMLFGKSMSLCVIFFILDNDDIFNCTKTCNRKNISK